MEGHQVKVNITKSSDENWEALISLEYKDVLSLNNNIVADSKDELNKAVNDSIDNLITFLISKGILDEDLMNFLNLFKL